MTWIAQTIKGLTTNKWDNQYPMAKAKRSCERLRIMIAQSTSGNIRMYVLPTYTREEYQEEYFVAVSFYDLQAYPRWNVRGARGNVFPENRVRLFEVVR